MTERSNPKVIQKRKGFAKLPIALLMTAVLTMVAGIAMIGGFTFGKPMTVNAAWWDGKTIATEFAGGDGTEQDPYQISDGTELAYLAKVINDGTTGFNADTVYYELTDNIILNDTTDWDDWIASEPANTWNPIGTTSTAFAANFNGNGFAVYGVYIEDSSSNRLGLFGAVSGTVSNVGVEQSYINGNFIVGGIAGDVNSGKLINCYNSGKVYGNGMVGGVAGVSVGDIESCYNTGMIAGYGVAGVGGVVGRLSGGSSFPRVMNCYNTGTVVSSNGVVGGVVGAVTLLTSGDPIGCSVVNCFNLGIVYSMDEAGGVVGSVSNSVSGTCVIANCYNLASVNGLTDIGGIAGSVQGSSTSITNCYFRTGTAAYGTNNALGYGSPLCKTDKFGYNGVITQDNNGYAGKQLLHALNDWVSSPTVGLPGDYSGWHGIPYPTLKLSNTEFGGGNGSQSNPYLLANEVHFKLFADLINNAVEGYCEETVYYKLTDDICLNNIFNWQNWATKAPANIWKPIGNQANPFNGNFDGNGFAVYGMYINNPDNSLGYEGLFGYVTGKVSNVGIEQSYIFGGSRTGAVAGAVQGAGASITNCYNAGRVVSRDSYVYFFGGVVGEIEKNGSVTDCYNIGTVIACGTGSADYVGGVAGGNFGGLMTNCYNMGMVTSVGNIVGGVVGRLGASDSVPGNVTNCVNIGLVSGSAGVGGVVGQNRENNLGKISNCHNTGAIISVYGSGGIVASLDGGSITNCYNTGAVSGAELGNSGVGGVCGSSSLSGGTVANCYNTGTVTAGAATTPRTGGLVGQNAGSIANCYNLGTIEGSTDWSGGIAGENAGGIEYCYNLEGFQSVGTDTGTGTSKTDAFDTTGTIIGNENGFSGRILLHALTEWAYNPTVGSISSYATWYDMPYPTFSYALFFTGGDGSAANPYLISNEVQLEFLALIVNAGDTVYNSATVYYKLACDIYLNDTSNWENWATVAPANSWTPIGSATNSFKANFDGDGHVVYGIYMNSTASYRGLFGYTTGPITIRNLGIEQSYIRGGRFTGAVAGYTYGSITNCYNAGIVSAAVGVIDFGGIVGYVRDGSITNCYNVGKASGNSVVGTNNNSSVTNCYYLEGTANSGVGSGTGLIDKFDANGLIIEDNNGYGGKILFIALNDWVSGEGGSASDYSEWFTKPYPRLKQEVITEICVTITPPVNGPNNSMTMDIPAGEEDKYTIEFRWYDVTNGEYMNSWNFIGGRIYYAEITVLPHSWDGYILSDSLDVYINGTMANFSAGTYFLPFTPALETISIAEILGVTAPENGTTPVTTITETAQFTGAIYWIQVPTAEGMIHVAMITINPKEGFTLDGVAADFFTVAGIETANFTNSGVITAVFPLTGDVLHVHSFVKTNAVAATCTTAGNEAYWTCTECGKFFADSLEITEISENDWIIPARGHDWETLWTSDGTGHWHACSLCDAIKDFETHSGGQVCDVCGYNAEAHVHNFTVEVKNNETLKSAATCTEAAMYWLSCSCGEISNTRLFVGEGPLGHDYATEWSCDGTGHWHDCSRCDAKTTKAAHDAGTWFTTLEPTVDDPGTKELRCTVCGFVLETGTIPPIVVVEGGETKVNQQEGYTFTIPGDFDENVILKVGAMTLEKGTDYTLAPGSTIVTITKAGLAKMGTGEHKIEVIFSDRGQAETTLTINPVNKDGFPIWAIVLIAVAALGLGCAGTWLVIRKKKV